MPRKRKAKPKKLITAGVLEDSLRRLFAVSEFYSYAIIPNDYSSFWADFPLGKNNP